MTLITNIYIKNSIRITYSTGVITIALSAFVFFFNVIKEHVVIYIAEFSGAILNNGIPNDEYGLFYLP